MDHDFLKARLAKSMSATSATTEMAVTSVLILMSCGEGPETIESLGTKNQILKITKMTYKDKTTAIHAATVRSRQF